MKLTDIENRTFVVVDAGPQRLLLERDGMGECTNDFILITPSGEEDFAYLEIKELKPSELK